MRPLLAPATPLIVQFLIKELEGDDKARGCLKWAWYTALDQDKPINASEKSRSCHSASRACLECGLMLQSSS